jgi:uncharacterized protein involved in cysteine biosynthesis
LYFLAFVYGIWKYRTRYGTGIRPAIIVAVTLIIVLIVLVPTWFFEHIAKKRKARGR